MSINGFIEKYKEKILLLSIIVAFLSSLIPFIYNAYTMWVIMTSVEVMIAWSFIAVSIGAGIIAFYTVLMKKSLFYPILYLGLHFILSIVLIVFEPIYIPLTVSFLLGLIAAKRNTNPERRFRPHLKNSRAAVSILICIIAALMPTLVNTAMVPQEFTLDPLYRDEPKEVELHFTLANLTKADTGPNGLLTILSKINALPHTNVSIVGAFLEEFALNTSLLFGETFREYGEFVKPFSYYNTTYPSFKEARDAYKHDVDTYEEYWNNFTKKTRAAVDLISDDQLLTNDSLYLNRTGSYYEIIQPISAQGINIDFMPLVEREIYINDFTIDRANKTFTIMKRWLSINHLPHRGIVVDTERMWGKDDQSIMAYHDKAAHDVAVAKLGRMIKDLKVFEWEQKGLKALHGEYTREKWEEFAIGPRLTMVAGATFGLHLFDLFDGDDAQQNLFKITILPEYDANNPDIAEFDFVGTMSYENGENSEQAIYGYCKAGDYFFGERHVPYIYSGVDKMQYIKDQPQKYVENLLRKYQIIRNYGYTTIGMWGLTHYYCFSDLGEGWCGGMYDFLNSFGGVNLIYDMCVQFENTWNQSISFTCDRTNYALTSTAISLLDMYILGSQRYKVWPIQAEFNDRIRPELFETTYDLVDLVFRLTLIIAFASFALYIFMLYRKSVEFPMKAGFYLNFSLFFAFTSLNFFFGELELQFGIYPEVIPEGTIMFLTSPRTSDIFMILFIILSAIPMLFGLEKYILDQKRFILTKMSLIALVMITIIIFWNDLLPVVNVVVLYGWLMLGLLLLRTVFVYFKIAIKSEGVIRKLGILMGIGFILLLVGTLGTGTIEPILGIPGEVIGHAIVLVGVLFIFNGIRQMQ